MSRLNVLHVLPAGSQVSEFSDEKISGILSDSPRLHPFRDGAEIDSVLVKRFPNRSRILLRSCFLTPDRVRGATADVLCCDEIQDILYDNMPVILETTQHSDRWDWGPIHIFAGTPKTTDSAIEYYWERESTQNEWVVRCEGCRTHIILGYENIGKFGLICQKCGKDLDPVANGQWYRTGPASSDIEGFRLPQLVFPYIYQDRPQLFETTWARLMGKVRNYKPHLLYNEVLALPYDAGLKPVTRPQLRACCTGPDVLPLEEIERVRGVTTFSGIDWGGGGDSYTVQTIWGYYGHKLRLIYYKRYEGFEDEPEHALQDTQGVMSRGGTNAGCLDFGNGYGLNSRFIQAIGRQRVWEVQYTTQKQRMKWDREAKRWMVSRTGVMSDWFDLIKRGILELPESWSETMDHPFITDVLAIYQTYTLSRGIEGMVYDHKPGTTDDSAHSGVYAFIASLVHHPRKDLL